VLWCLLHAWWFQNCALLRLSVPAVALPFGRPEDKYSHSHFLFLAVKRQPSVPPIYLSTILSFCPYAAVAIAKTQEIFNHIQDVRLYGGTI
jgi:hypothetical protein